MAEGLQPTPEQDAEPQKPTLEAVVHEVSHQESVEEVEARSAEVQGHLLNMVSPERREEIIAQTTKDKEDTTEAEDDLQQAA